MIVELCLEAGACFVAVADDNWSVVGWVVVLGFEVGNHHIRHIVEGERKEEVLARI